MRFDVFVHLVLPKDETSASLGRIETLLEGVSRRVRLMVKFDAEILAAIAEEKTAVDSIVAAIEGGVIGAELDPEDKALLVNGLRANADALNALLPANVEKPTSETVSAAVTAAAK